MLRKSLQNISELPDTETGDRTETPSYRFTAGSSAILLCSVPRSSQRPDIQVGTPSAGSTNLINST